MLLRLKFGGFMELKDKKILVTGGAGFIGSHVVNYLREIGCHHVFVPRSKDYNLLSKSDLDKLFINANPEIVIHLAAKVGGIQDIKEHPGDYYYENLMMSTELLHKCVEYKVKKFIAVGTNCSYPENIEIPFKEECFWDGYPQKTNAAYGIAKKALYQQCLSYKEQYGLDFIYLIPTNSYGEGDHFDEESGHVIPALIKKVIHAKNNGCNEVTLWGSGKATREFIYVKDLARALVQATILYHDITPLNIGTGIETTIKELAELIAELTGYKGHINWDKTKPEGYMRKCLSNKKMQQILPNTSFLTLREGLEKTINWVNDNNILVRKV